MWTIFIWSYILLSSVSCSELYSKHKYQRLKEEEKKVDKLFFGGLFPGECTKDAVYIRDAYSLVFCSNRNKYIQPCAPGTRNGPLHAYLPGGKYGSTDFCNVNLVPYGDTPYMYPILQYGGLPLPFRRTEREAYHPYPFSPEQIYPRRDEPHKSKLIKSGYLQPLDGYKVGETIKDTHIYEKPHTVHGYHQNDLEKDYYAIKESYHLRKKADDEFEAAYKEVNKVRDDYKPEYEFEKFAKNYNGYSKAEHKIETYDAPKKPEEKLKKDKKVKYKETRYQPPLMKPNKYGEIKDIPPKYKELYEKETLKYDAHDPPKYEPPLYEPTVDEDITYDKDDDSPPYDHTSYNSPSYHEPKHDDHKYDSQKYESPPPETTKKVYKSIDDDDREFDRFDHLSGYADTKSKGSKYLDGKFGEYRVGHVENTSEGKPKKSYSAPLKEEIHGSHYITH